MSDQVLRTIRRALDMTTAFMEPKMRVTSCRLSRCRAGHLFWDDVPNVSAELPQENDDDDNDGAGASAERESDHDEEVEDVAAPLRPVTFPEEHHHQPLNHRQHHHLLRFRCVNEGE